MQTNIYAILDTIAQDVVGPLWTYRHDAPAIRQFRDIVMDTRTELAKHPGDFNLVFLGVLDTDHDTPTIVQTEETRVVITGAAIHAAAQQAARDQLSLGE